MYVYGGSKMATNYITDLKTKLAKKEAQLLALETAFTAGSIEVESFAFDSGEGSQKTKFRSLKEMGEMIDILEKQISSIKRKISCNGVMSFGLKGNGGV